MKQKGDRIKEEEEEEEEEWEITHISMAFQHSLTRSRLHIPHTSSLVIRSWHDPTTIKQGTDPGDKLMKNGRKRVRIEWGNETERRQNQREKMGDHSHLHGLPTLAHKIPSPHPTHEQSGHKILTRPDDHQARHRHSWPSNEEWKRREESEGMKQKGDRIKEEEEEEEEEWEITHISMAFQHSLTRSRLHIPHTNSLVIRSWHDPTTIRQGTDTRDRLMKNESHWVSFKKTLTPVWPTNSITISSSEFRIKRRLPAAVNSCPSGRSNTQAGV
jgi:hypothetical protein